VKRTVSSSVSIAFSSGDSAETPRMRPISSRSVSRMMREIEAVMRRISSGSLAFSARSAICA
jgi:hypothetical protein